MQSLNVLWCLEGMSASSEVASPLLRDGENEGGGRELLAIWSTSWCAYYTGAEQCTLLINSKALPFQFNMMLLGPMVQTHGDALGCR